MIANNNFLVPNATFPIELLAFLLVLGFLAWKVLPPINKAMEERQHKIEHNMSEAEQANKRAQDLEQQQREALEQARVEARALKDAAAKVGDELRRELQKRGEEEYQRLVSKAGVDIESAARKAAEELRGQVAELVVAVVERVLGDGIGQVAQQQLIDRAISDLEAELAAGRLTPLGTSPVAGM
ncbi:MAG TPA: F0F1 ATP synthase subunit B [Acidimicrobiales bacterium]|nr:F0F1 ATP synthase subunit B [Acidimicrobiales bacterium]